MAVVAGVMLALWGVVAIGLRGWLHVRRTGASPFVGGAGTDGRLAIAGFAPGLIGPVLDLTETLPRVARGQWLGPTGVTLAVGALVVAVWAQLVMGDSWRIGVDPTERTALVRSGPFRVARNPIYSTMIVFFVGLALLVPNLATLIWPLVVAVGLDVHVRLIEEPHLTSVHGTDYLDYAHHTGRFLPGIGKLT
jgi:protein-S-isoprenylcysteine O-methyltransferase Ste14